MQPLPVPSLDKNAEGANITITELRDRSKTMKLGLLNSTIATTDGTYVIKTISLEEAIALVQGQELDSAIGHQSIAQVMSTLLGIQIPVNRQEFQQQEGQKCLVFKLNGRPPEGKVLSLEEIHTMGFAWKLMELKTPFRLKFTGYAWGEGRNNPDGSVIHDGQPVYETPDGKIAADGYFLLEHGFQSGLGDNPEVPEVAMRWFRP
jgi:hypothetical protein